MKRTRRKNIVRGVGRSLNRFLSILFIVALGAGFLAGLFATSPDMYEAADRYMDEHDWYDLDVKASQGFTDEDASAIAQTAGVEAVQPARVVDMMLLDGDSNSLTARVYALPHGEGAMNGYELLEGRAPENASECVVQVASGRYGGVALNIGDTLTVSHENANYDALLDEAAAETLTVVGIVESPMCISVEADSTSIGSGAIGVLVFAHEDYIDLDVYTDVFVAVSGAKALNTFADDYDALIEPVKEALDALGDERAPMRTQALRDEAMKSIDDMDALVSALESEAAVQRALSQDAAARLEQSMTVAALLGDSPISRAIASTARAVESGLSARQNAAEDGQARLERLKEQLSDARAEVEAIEDGFWLTRDRSASAGYASYSDNVEKVAALCRIFPVFFFLVALLVALTTMTRLVEENRAQIGTLKSLGFSDGQVLAEYILYSLSSSALGCALGFAVGFKLFPKVISAAYGMMYTLPAIETPFRLEVALLVAPVTIGGILLATLLSCWGTCRSCPAALMTPSAPPAGKRILLERIKPLWNRLSFSRKVTCRNLFRYKKRFIMTVVGVAGCSALLVTGFGLRDSIHDIVDKQFGEIYLYQLTLRLDKSDALETDDTLKDFLSEPGLSALSFAAESGRVEKDGRSEAVSLSVPKDTSAFPDFVTLRERKSGEALTLGGGAILTEKLCEQLNVRAGDTVTLEDKDGRKAAVTVDGVTENYLTAFAYMTPEAYESAFGHAPDYTTLLCRLEDEAQADAAVARALRSDHVIFTRSSLSLKETFADSVRSIDSIVLVLILSAGILCMVVMYNLTNVNICERRGELATMRVLGFYEREVEKYIFRETNTLSLIGALAGLPLGIWLHSFVVRTVEVNAVMFGRTIKPMSYVYALAISVVFTLLVNEVMRRSIRRIDMVESLKARD